MKCTLVENGSALQSFLLTCLPDPEPWWKSALAFAPAILLAVSLVSVVLAYLALRNTRALARQKATLDLIDKFESNEVYRMLVVNLNKLRRAGYCFRNEALIDSDFSDRQIIIDFLNNYERIMIGISKRIYDESIFWTLMGHAAVSHWNVVAPFVQGERWQLSADGTVYTYNGHLWVHFEKAVRRWSRAAAVIDDVFCPPLPRRMPGFGDDPSPSG